MYLNQLDDQVVNSVKLTSPKLNSLSVNQWVLEDLAVAADLEDVVVEIVVTVEVEEVLLGVIEDLLVVVMMARDDKETGDALMDPAIIITLHGELNAIVVKNLDLMEMMMD
jgi:hypothetical protein